MKTIDIEKLKQDTPVNDGVVVELVPPPLRATLFLARKSANRWQATLSTTSIMGEKTKVRGGIEASIPDAIESMSKAGDRRINRDICAAQAMLDARSRIWKEED